jgi:hypothetical protein
MRFLIRLLVVTFVCVSAQYTFAHTQNEALDDYVVRINKLYAPTRVVPKGEVLVKKQDVNQDGSDDLTIYDGSRCSMQGCDMDIYLCTAKDTTCQSNHYCFAGSLKAGNEMKKKGASLKCKE